MFAFPLHAELAASNPAPLDRTGMLPEALTAGAIVAGVFLAGALALALIARRRTGASKPAEPGPASDAGSAQERAAQPGDPARGRDDDLVDRELRNRYLDRRITSGVDVGDGILASLSEVARTLESSRVMIYTDPHAYEDRLRSCVRSLNAAIDSLRACVVGPDSKVVRSADFRKALDGRLSELKARHGAQFVIAVDEEAVAVIGEGPLAAMLEVAGEAASNALTHGHSKIVTLRLRRDGRSVAFTVQDNGRGFAPDLAGSPGRGMTRMRELAREVGGRLDVAARLGNGTKVTLTVRGAPPAPGHGTS